MSIVLLGSTSGSCTLQEQAVAGTTTLTLPTFNGTVGLLVSGTAVASTSGTSIDFTGIPAGVRRITVMFQGVSTNGSSVPIIQLGDAGGIETTGYLGAATTNGAGANFTTGIALSNTAAGTNIRHATIIISSFGSNAWSAFGCIAQSESAAGGTTASSKTLSDTLTQLRITTVNGTDTFDAGSINILYE
jgi:hypothetical protein